MKTKHTLLLLFPFFLCSFTNPKIYLASSYNGKAYDAKEMMDFSDLTESEIDSYYSSITSESYGKTFINEIYNVISQNNYFISYGSGADSGVNRWYKITDRNWELSREITPETYKFSEDTASNHYLSLLYFEDNTTKERAINSYVNGSSGWTYDSNITYVDYTNNIKNNQNIQQDKEHIWAKSHGINSTGDPNKGAGTDLHHLLAADHKTNNIHNNNDYGYVDKDKSYDTIYCYYANGDTDISGWSGVDKNGNSVFEPTDQYKGDIARALLYMATRYSNKLDTNTEAEPYLQLTDDVTLTDDMANFHGVIHNLSDLLEWNELDPVSQYEIHRNNLIYNNVQRNRNPYIDHPEWARRAFDEETYLSESNFNELENSYNLHIGTSFKLPIVYSDTSTIKVEYDSNYLKIDSDNLTVTPLKESTDGSLEIKLIEVTKNNVINEYVTTIYALPSPTITINNPIEDFTIEENQTIDLDYDLNNTFKDETLSFKMFDSTIASIDGKTIKGLKEGTTTLTINLKGQQTFLLDTITINVKKKGNTDTEVKLSDFSKLKDSYNLHIGTSFKLPIVYSDTSTIKVEYDSNYLKIDSDNLTITPLKESTTGYITLKFLETTPSNKTYSYETKIYIKEKPTIEIRNSDSLTIKENESLNLTYDLKNTYSTENIKLVSNDESIAKIEGNSIKGLKEGTTTMDIYLVGEQDILIKSIQISITKDSGTLSDTQLILIGVAAVVIFFLCAIIPLVIKKQKKKRKSEKARVEKIKKERRENLEKVKERRKKKK